MGIAVMPAWSRLILVGAASLVAACETIKPYEKEYLLSPLMDDAAISALETPLMSSAAATFERLGAGGGGAGGNSCPTCGG